MSTTVIKNPAPKKALGAVTSVHRLPYPRYPVLNPAQDQCPAFCYGHAECFGKTACPHRYACSE